MKTVDPAVTHQSESETMRKWKRTIPRRRHPLCQASIQEDYYFDGPYMVFTAAYLLKRGTCCGSGCRHCPYRGTDRDRNPSA